MLKETTAIPQTVHCEQIKSMVRIEFSVNVTSQDSAIGQDFSFRRDFRRAPAFKSALKSSITIPKIQHRIVSMHL